MYCNGWSPTAFTYLKIIMVIVWVNKEKERIKYGSKNGLLESELIVTPILKPCSNSHPNPYPHPQPHPHCHPNNICICIMYIAI